VVSSGVPAWAPAVASPHADDGDVDLVARVVRLAASPWPHPDRVRRLLAARIDHGLDTGGPAVVSALEGAVRRAGAVAAPASVESMATRLAQERARVLVVGAEGYPSRLASAWPDLGAPLWLFLRDDAAGQGPPDAPTVAVVGTRHPSADGLRTAGELAALLARSGVVVVSGLARGIDQAAHEGALRAGGLTAAVLGTGLGVDYPAGDHGLRARVARSAGLLTEYVPGVAPRGHNFLWRNRIISGLADATVVVEGRARSGALQTARMAASQGREVLAVPGSVNQPTARGPLDLIRDGVQPLTRLADVLEVLRLDSGDFRARPAAEDATGVHADLLRLLGPVPASPAELSAASGQPIQLVLAALAELRARGRVTATPRGFVAATTIGRSRPG